MRLHGFIDSHLHLLGLGYVMSNVDLTDATSVAEILRLLEPHKDAPIILGRGWNQNRFSDHGMITRADLDRVSKDIPIVLVRVCGHVLVVNSRMLELAGLDSFTPAVDGGTFDLLTGLFTEKALSLIYDKMPQPTDKMLEDYLIQANDHLIRHGVTTVASDNFCIFSLPYEKIIHVIEKLYRENRLQVRMTEQVHLGYKDLEDFIAKGYVNRSFGKYRMGPLKILADGSLGGQTAALIEPYSDDPTNRGIRTYSDEELFRLVHLADRHQMDVVIHAIGDAAVKQALDALIRSLEITRRMDHHHAIIHAQMAGIDDIERMRRWQIGAIIQPIFLNSDIPMIRSRIGARAEHTYLFKTMASVGLQVAFSTDSPVEPVDPFKNLYTAITRKSLSYPAEDAFLEEEGYNISQAIDAYTKGGLPFVYLDRLPENDYIRVDKDPYKASVDTLKDIHVKEVVIDGIQVYHESKEESS